MAEEKFNRWDGVLLHLGRRNSGERLIEIIGMIMSRCRLRLGCFARRRIEERPCQVVRRRQENKTHTDEYLSVEHVHRCTARVTPIGQQEMTLRREETTTTLMMQSNQSALRFDESMSTASALYRPTQLSTSLMQTGSLDFCQYLRRAI